MKVDENNQQQSAIDDVESLAGKYRKAKASKGIAKKLLSKKIIAALGTIGGGMLALLLMFFLIFFIVFPFNVVRYGDETMAADGGPAPTVGSAGFKISDMKYAFLQNMYEFNESLENLAFSIMHPIQASQAADVQKELEKELGDKGIKMPDINTVTQEDGTIQGSEYTRTVTSLVTTMNSAFRKGWSRTMVTAKYRAEMVEESLKGDSKIVVDTYDDKDLWNERTDFWDKNGWKRSGSDYEAGTYPKEPGAVYVDEYTGEKTIINRQIVNGNEGEQPVYLLPELHIIAYQNSAEQAVKGIQYTQQTVNGQLQQVPTGNAADYGIVIDYGDEDVPSEVAASTQYQLLRTAGEIAGRGIIKQDLNDATHEAENKSIYVILTETTITPTAHYQDVKKQVLVGYEQKIIGYEQKFVGYKQKQKIKYVNNRPVPVFDKNGNPVMEDDLTQPIYADDITRPIWGDDETKPIYEYPYDHTDVWVSVDVKTEYSLELKPNTQELIKLKMEEKMGSEEERTAFNQAVQSYHQVQFESLCEMFAIDPSTGSDAWYDDESGAGFKPVPGGFAWPLPDGIGRLSRGYRGRHRGFDWAAGEGTPIFAAADGVVKIAEHHKSWGNHVRIEHANGIQTNYAHMVQPPSVVTGQTVKQGQVIGYVGNTGNSFGNHLHLEVWMGNSPDTRVDPQPYFPMKVLHNGNG